MIDEQYINEGIRIRKLYMQNLKQIIKEEPKIMDRKTSFEKLQEEMGNIVKSDLNEMRKTLELNEKLIFLEKEIKYIQDIIRPYYNNIENLKSDRDRLYLSIKEKYPNITEQQIEREIMSKVDE
jgi:hypothetical protein